MNYIYDCMMLSFKVFIGGFCWFIILITLALVLSIILETFTPEKKRK